MGKQNLSQRAACAQQAKQVKSLFLESLIDNMPFMYAFWKNADGAYLGCNIDFAELVGLENPDDIIGKTDEELAWPLLDDMNLDEWLHFLSEQDSEVLDGNMIEEREIRLIQDDGTRLTLRLNKFQITNENETQVLGITGFFRKIK